MSAAFLGIDTETTGLSAVTDQVIEIYLRLMDEQFEPIDELHIYAHPDDGVEIHPSAAAINGYTREGWDEKGAVTQQCLSERVYAFISPFKRLKCVAHNAAFDTAFLRKIYERADGDVSYDKCVGYHHIDTIPITIFMDLSAGAPLRRSYSLVNLTKDHDIAHDNAHSARADLQACLDLLKVHIQTARGLLSPVAVVEKKSEGFSRIIKQASDGEYTFQYGAHTGMPVAAIAKENPGYIRFVLGFTDLNPVHRTYLENVLSQ